MLFLRNFFIYLSLVVLSKAQPSTDNVPFNINGIGRSRMPNAGIYQTGNSMGLTSLFPMRGQYPYQQVNNFFSFDGYGSDMSDTSVIGQYPYQLANRMTGSAEYGSGTRDTLSGFEEFEKNIGYNNGGGIGNDFSTNSGISGFGMSMDLNGLGGYDYRMGQMPSGSGMRGGFGMVTGSVPSFDMMEFGGKGGFGMKTGRGYGMRGGFGMATGSMPSFAMTEFGGKGGFGMATGSVPNSYGMQAGVGMETGSVPSFAMTEFGKKMGREIEIRPGSVPSYLMSGFGKVNNFDTPTIGSMNRMDGYHEMGGGIGGFGMDTGMSAMTGQAYGAGFGGVNRFDPETHRMGSYVVGGGMNKEIQGMRAMSGYGISPESIPFQSNVAGTGSFSMGNGMFRNQIQYPKMFNLQHINKQFPLGSQYFSSMGSNQLLPRYPLQSLQKNDQIYGLGKSGLPFRYQSNYASEEPIVGQQIYNSFVTDSTTRAQQFPFGRQSSSSMGRQQYPRRIHLPYPHENDDNMYRVGESNIPVSYQSNDLESVIDQIKYVENNADLSKSKIPFLFPSNDDESLVVDLINEVVSDVDASR